MSLGYDTEVQKLAVLAASRLHKSREHPGPATVIRFPVDRILRTKEQQRRLQAIYRDPTIRKKPLPERFQLASLAMSVEIAMTARGGAE